MEYTFVQDKLKSENTTLEEKLKGALLVSEDLEQEKEKLQEEVSKIKVHHMMMDWASAMSTHS